VKKLTVPLIVVVLLLALFPVGVLGDAGYRLVAGQNQIVGHVFVTNDDDNLYITFDMKDGLGFCLNETQVHVADLWSDIPQTSSGNPKIGQFDYKGTHNCVDTVSYTVPLDDLDGNGDGQLTIAAHAVVGMWFHDLDYSETGWGVVCGDINNNQFPGGSWAVYMPYTIK
jgi:hypothetical protein